MPKGGITLYNTCGTAPGCIMEKDGKIAVILPGPPSEMRAMFESAKEHLTKEVKSLAENKEKITVIFDTAPAGGTFGWYILHLAVWFFHRHF